MIGASLAFIRATTDQYVLVLVVECHADFFSVRDLQLTEWSFDGDHAIADSDLDTARNLNRFFTYS